MRRSCLLQQLLLRIDALVLELHFGFGSRIDEIIYQFLMGSMTKATKTHLRLEFYKLVIFKKEKGTKGIIIIL